MPENQQDRVDQQENRMPEEFRRYRKALEQRSGNLTTLDEKIEMWTYFLEAWRQNLSASPHRKQALLLLLPILRNCSTFCFQRYQQQRQREDLDLSIELIQEALQNTEEGAPELLQQLEHLGLVLSLRYNLTRSLDDLEASFSAWRRALDNASDDSSQAKYLYCLGQFYKERYRLLKSQDDLQQSIQCLETGTQLDTSAKRCDSLNLLAFMFRERYALTQDINDSKHADQAWREAVSLLPWQDPTVKEILKNIAAIQAGMYAVTQQREDLEESITYWQIMLARMPDTQAFKAEGYNYLGYSLAMRFELTHDLQDLNQAVRVQERAIELADAHPSERADYLHNLHSILSVRYSASPNTADQKRIKQVENEMRES